ncbi:hypothetical protein TNCV_1089651 [Trichonephila clavipes]|uniref:Uncharacterized protein n=1 Tax=Trichonephila clavipes TaxID=2585209 RepID=A0A8X6SNW4_TRICX|nr:hypothetical protein TNCV_1089651 [Trichonephila clavipes]
MSSFLVLREGDNRNRWRDGQVCRDVGQGIMALWARRPGCVLVCYTQIGRGRPRETFVTCQEGTRGVLWTHPWCLKGVLFQEMKKRLERGARPWMEKKEKALPWIKKT